MPSYRAILTVGQLRATVPASEVLPEVAAILAKRTTVEANDLRVSRGKPQLVLRFTGSDPAFARAVVEECLADMNDVIEITAVELLARFGGRWVNL